jgi:3-oxo-5alpha-steroid 4-dehydrogenase
VSDGTMQPSDPGWHSYVEAPLHVRKAEAVEWFDCADVIVVGFGGAGACAALEARALGAEVLAIDRYSGGGATSVSGGVYYGGGTRIQRKAGIEDSAEELFAYLKIETQGVVKDETLWKFCRDSSANLDWLAGHGVPFAESLYEHKTVYPPDGYFLYYAGNELLPRYQKLAKPAPRGHRTVGKGIFCGSYLFKALNDAAQRSGVRLLPHSPVTRLVLDDTGAVIGVEVNHLAPGTAARRKHEKAYRRFQSLLRLIKPRALAAIKQHERLERDAGQRRLIRARRAVILATGSFSYNQDMVRHYAPGYVPAMPVGTAGCDGSGIRLGQTVGGVTAQMQTVSAWRWISPPLSFVEGIIVDRDGKRFVEEDSYSGRLGEQIGEHRGHTAYLILDRRSYRRAWKETSPFQGRFLVMGLPILLTLLRNCRKGRTLDDVAAYYGVPAESLLRTVAEYNADALRGEDSIGKNPDYLRPLSDGPYYIVDISTGNQISLCGTIPMGGLRVNEETGSVIRSDGSDIPGLYAAGRNAIGIPSHFYVSGTSIADCVFAGRRAGLHAARSSRSLPRSCAPAASPV